MQTTKELKRRKLISDAENLRLQNISSWFEEIKNSVNTSSNASKQILRLIGTCNDVNAPAVKQEILNQFFHKI